MQAFQTRQIFPADAGRIVVHQRRTEVHAAPAQGRPHGMPSPALQTAASSRRATYFRTTAALLRAAINP